MTLIVPTKLSPIAQAIKSVPAAVKALTEMEREMDQPATFERIRKLIKDAEDIKTLYGDVTVVKQRAEWAILVGNARIGTELGEVPKATRAGPGRGKKQISLVGKLFSEKVATGIPGVSRHRLMKLARIAREELRNIAAALWSAGKDATVRGVLGENKEAEIKRERAAFEKRRDRGGNATDLDALIAAGKKFGVIYADPAWEFKVYSGKGKQRSAERRYDTESVEKIKALSSKVRQLAADDCALFLWAVMPELPGALEVMQDWGFEYKTAGFVWVKTTKTAEYAAHDGEGLHWGMGYWTRANAEVCLLGTKGSPKRDEKDVHQVVISPVGEHSEKPEEVAARIERLLLGDYLELYGRRERPGWTVWGNEVARQEAAE